MLSDFEREQLRLIRQAGADDEVRTLSLDFIRLTAKYRYSYNFSFLGRPVIQFPQDLMAAQEIIWRTRPQLIIETGIAHGGSLIFYAAMLELLGGEGRVLGIDIDIRAHNRRAIEEHPLAKRIDMIEGSSISPEIVSEVRRRAEAAGRVMVCLDSNHTHEHVLAELRAYSDLVRRGDYLIVFDTVVEDLPPDFYPDRPWGRGNNPKTAVHEFLADNDRFEIDRDVEAKTLITVAPDGYLRCVKE